MPIAFSELDTFSTMARLVQVVQGAQATGLTTSDESRRLRADLEEAAHIGGFYASVQSVLVAGRTSVGTADC